MATDDDHNVGRPVTVGMLNDLGLYYNNEEYRRKIRAINERAVDEWKDQDLRRQRERFVDNLIDDQVQAHRRNELIDEIVNNLPKFRLRWGLVDKLLDIEERERKMTFWQKWGPAIGALASIVTISTVLGPWFVGLLMGKH